jgi:hypothetical protein
MHLASEQGAYQWHISGSNKVKREIKDTSKLSDVGSAVLWGLLLQVSLPAMPLSLHADEEAT